MANLDELMRRWMRAGENLRKLDPERFDRVLALVDTYLSIYADNEDEDTFQARLRRINPGAVN